MNRVPDKIDFAEEEEKISKSWGKSEIFRNSLKQSATNEKFTFFDGPPFATGLPHYGHVLAGTVKDIVTRFSHQSGYFVGRRFGWDCHGLPVEYEIDKALKISGPDDVAKMGIANYNAECRKIVMRYSHEWETVMNRLARWIDFEDDYKTMYPWYMESIWFVFRELYTKGLVYKGVKVMPYSTACNTPLSNFESGQNYKDVVDPQVMIGFPLETEPQVQLVAWTTTPWTLPSNLTLCVHPDFIYVKVKSLKNNKVYILMESRLSMLFKSPQDYTVMEKFPGSELKGLRYQPLFPYFVHMKAKGAFQILADKYVTDDAGTGVVHQAPYFGEDDYRICLAAGIISRDQEIICPVDASGCFTEPVKDFLKQHVKVADKNIIQYLKANSPSRLIDASTLKHSYPFCWRSDTPLIYRAVPSWFVRVEPMVEALLKASQATYWVPDFVKEKRFGNWLRGAKDWAISRNRYWGTPIPIWSSEDGKEIVCVGSISELEQLSGQKMNDLHRESVDNVTIPSVRPGMPPLRRVPEVFDCWFESGSMPYAQVHFPFSRDTEIAFHDGFPADFIAEGIDQTRGWFYTLLVVSTALFNKAPYKNLIAHGLVLASDGQKMSKSKKNYPDPMEVVRKYGADALRLYLINSPVVRADNLRFKEEGVRDVLKDVMLPWYNAYRYLVQSCERLTSDEGIDLVLSDKGDHVVTNTMDKWMRSATQTMVATVWREMQLYHLYKVVPLLVNYIDQLTNWYIRMNRRRLRGDAGVEECLAGLRTLFEVLWTFVRLMSPFTPYICELMFQNLKKQMNEPAESCHLIELPKPLTAHIDLLIERRVNTMQYIISAGRLMRDKKAVPIKYPLSELVVIHKNRQYLDDVQAMESYILEELNVKRLVLSSDCDQYHVTLGAQVDHKVLGARLKGDFKKVLQAVQALNDDDVQNFVNNGSMSVAGHPLTLDDVFISYCFDESRVDKERYEVQGSQEVALMLDMERNSAMLDEGLAREVVNLVQKLRKKGQLVPTDPITVLYKIVPADSDLAGIVTGFASYIESSLRVPLRPAVLNASHQYTSIVQEVCQPKGTKATIELEIVQGFAADWKISRLAEPVEQKASEGKQNKEKPVRAEKVTKKTTDQKEATQLQRERCMEGIESLVPCVRYVILQPYKMAGKDSYSGVIVALENPLGFNKVTGADLQQIAAQSFGLLKQNVSVWGENGVRIDANNEPVVTNSNTLWVTSTAERPDVSPFPLSKSLPNQPFVNVSWKDRKGVVFLNTSQGNILTAHQVKEACLSLFKLQNETVTLIRQGKTNNLILKD